MLENDSTSEVSYRAYEVARFTYCSCLDYLLYGRMYIPTGRLDALYSTRLSRTLQAQIAAISDRRATPAPANSRSRPGELQDNSNVMLSLQHDTGRWCTEYTWSADDGMWGARVLHNFGRLAGEVDREPKREKGVDEEEAMEGGLKGRFSAGAEVYFSAKEKSAGGGLVFNCFDGKVRSDTH